MIGQGSNKSLAAAALEQPGVFLSGVIRLEPEGEKPEEMSRSTSQVFKKEREGEREREKRLTNFLSLKSLQSFSIDILFRLRAGKIS